MTIEFSENKPMTMRESYIIGKLFLALEKHYKRNCECDACKFADWIMANLGPLTYMEKIDEI